MTVHVVAEVGSVHDGSFGNACKLVELARDVGADSVKFQMHDPTGEMLVGAPEPAYFDTEDRFSYLSRTAFSLDKWAALVQLAHAKGLGFVCSPFSNQAVDNLVDLGVDALKVASGEVTNRPLLRAIAASGLQTFLSTGMSSWEEVDRAVGEMSDLPELTILQCTSIYPTANAEVGLNVLAELRDRYGRPFGISDHTPEIFAPIGAVALGASVVEKHLTFSRAMYGSDAFNALEPREFEQMVRGIRQVDEMASNPVNKDSMAIQLTSTKLVFEKRLVAAVEMKSGDMLTEDMIVLRKSASGILASQLERVLGRPLKRRLQALDPVEWEDLV